MTGKSSKLALVAAVFLALFIGPSAEAQAAPDWNSVNDFVYQLQDVNLDALGETEFDLVVMDYSRDGSDEERYSAGEVADLKSSPGGPKLVLSYMSIGEAEDYRWYWQRSWDANQDGRPDAGAPAWLGRSNPDWPGNYKVRYWDPAWQSIVYEYVDKVQEAGYDGIYLDIVDAYEYWGPAESPASTTTPLKKRWWSSSRTSRTTPGSRKVSRTSASSSKTPKGSPHTRTTCKP